MLSGELARAPLPPQEQYGYLFLVARPLFPDDAMFEQAAQAYYDHSGNPSRNENSSCMRFFMQQ